MRVSRSETTSKSKSGGTKVGGNVSGKKVEKVGSSTRHESTAGGTESGSDCEGYGSSNDYDDIDQERMNNDLDQQTNFFQDYNKTALTLDSGSQYKYGEHEINVHVTNDKQYETKLFLSDQMMLAQGMNTNGDPFTDMITMIGNAQIMSQMVLNIKLKNRKFDKWITWTSLISECFCLRSDWLLEYVQFLISKLNNTEEKYYYSYYFVPISTGAIGQRTVKDKDHAKTALVLLKHNTEG